MVAFSPALILVIQLGLSLYVSGNSQAAAPLLELRGSNCELVILCSGPLRGHLYFRYLSISPGWTES